MERKKQGLQSQSLIKQILNEGRSRDKEGHYIMVKGDLTMQQEDLIILNIYATNTGAPRYIKQVLNDQ